MIDRFPRARGPNSIRPWKSPTTIWFATSFAISGAQSRSESSLYA